MTNGLPQSLRRAVRQVYDSIAFYPALLSVAFLVASFGMLAFDDSEFGKELKSKWEWLRLRDADTARAIVGAVVTGLITLTVFSSTMVMVVLTQAASHMSNRVLDSLIRNRFQQFVLGFYLGTIVFAMLLLASIRDIDQGITVPALSAYVLIGMTICNFFLFIYFLHFVTQSVRYNVVIRRIARETHKAMKTSCRLNAMPTAVAPRTDGKPVVAKQAGIYQGVKRDALLEICRKYNVNLTLPLPPGIFVLPGSTVCIVHGIESLSGDMANELLKCIELQPDQSIPDNYVYGFDQLTEVAVKALSPGVNDPGTAIQALRSLGSLLAFRQCRFPESAVRDAGDTVVLWIRELTFAEVMERTLLPIWDYGKNDRLIQAAMLEMLKQLQDQSPSAEVLALLRAVQVQSIAQEKPQP